MFESGFPEHAIVQKELDQVLTRAAGRGVWVKISIKATKTIGNVLINLNLKFFRLPVF